MQKKNAVNAPQIIENPNASIPLPRAASRARSGKGRKMGTFSQLSICCNGVTITIALEHSSRRPAGIHIEHADSVFCDLSVNNC